VTTAGIMTVVGFKAGLNRGDDWAVWQRAPRD
jgi:hypothetical protein